jgi:hypothetical protein
VIKFARLGAAAFVVGIAALYAPACASNVEDVHDDDIETDRFGLTFTKETLLSDAEFTDSSAMSADQIQTFLEKPYCGGRSSLADYSEGGQTAAQMIASAAQINRINPIEFLVRLQVERSLICKPATDYAIKEALSCGCPDGAPCASAYAGFGKQITCAGGYFRKYLDQISTKGSDFAGWGPGRAKNTLDPYSVTPSNAATAALYTYTPWVYNGGNYLHWQVWNSVAKYLGYTSSGITPDKPPSTGPKATCAAGSSDCGCSTDVDCSHGVVGAARVCATAGPERGTCIDGCHADADCPTGGTCDTTVTPHSQCTNQPAAAGTECMTDEDCNGSGSAPGRLCNTDTHKCQVACRSDADCGAGKDGKPGYCDLSLKVYTCVYRKELGDACAVDSDCNGGVGGTARVCSNDKVCIDGCHANFDCDSSSQCDKTASPWVCNYTPNTTHATGPDGCAALTFPSGITLKTKVDAVLEASYKNHVKAGQAIPHCFIDIDDLKNPDTGEKYDYATVKVSAHFGLKELVDSEASAWGHRVLLDPGAVTDLENFRVSVATPFSPTSGFRSPLHQESTCKRMCGAIQCYNASGHVTCSQYSRHMFGGAFDLPYEFYSRAYAKTACSSGFHFAYNENHDHLHVDNNPDISSCVIQFD